MLRMTSCVTIAFLLTVVTGCGKPEAPLTKGNRQKNPLIHRQCLKQRSPNAVRRQKVKR